MQIKMKKRKRRKRRKNGPSPIRANHETPAGLRAWARRERAEARREERERPAGMVQEGTVRIHLVPVEQRATKRVAVQDRQSGLRQMEVWGGDDRDTRGGRVSRAGSVETGA